MFFFYPSSRRHLVHRFHLNKKDLTKSSKHKILWMAPVYNYIFTHVLFLIKFFRFWYVCLLEWRQGSLFVKILCCFLDIQPNDNCVLPLCHHNVKIFIFIFKLKNAKKYIYNHRAWKSYLLVSFSRMPWNLFTVIVFLGYLVINNGDCKVYFRIHEFQNQGKI